MSSDFLKGFIVGTAFACSAVMIFYTVWVMS